MLPPSPPLQPWAQALLYEPYQEAPQGQGSTSHCPSPGSFYSYRQRLAPEGEKPEVVKTHLRNMIIVPEMIGSVVGVYNGRDFTTVEIRAEMIGHYLAEFSISYKPTRHGRPGIGGTKSSRFIPLK